MVATALRDHLFVEESARVPEQAGLESLRAALSGPTTGRELADTIATRPDLDEAGVGLTVSGPAYEDNPILAVNAGFEAITGYDAAAVRGRNPRFLQGSDTEAEAVADLAEAIAIWKPVRVDLTNYRADGTPFRNRVGLVPIEDASGTVTNWLGIQEPR